MRSIIITLFTLLILTTACRNKDLIRPGDPLNVAYDKSLALFEEEKYDDAAYGFDLVTRMGRGTNFSKDAQFFLAESYFFDRQYILAASEYERFISYYPQDEKREQVEYKLALCFYEQSPRYRLDQTPTRRAIQLFRLFNNKYPDSELVVESAQKIDELRNKLARKSFEAGEFYLRTSRYVAASIYFDQVVDQYPESKWAEQSLLKQIETYITYADNSITEKQVERYTLAVDNYEKFIQLFPQSKNRGNAESMYSDAIKKIANVDSDGIDDSLGIN
jgi:outer membrane protein assembly factor BamD